MEFFVTGILWEEESDKRDVFLAEISSAVPWDLLAAQIGVALHEDWAPGRPASVPAVDDVTTLLPATVA